MARKPDRFERMVKKITISKPVSGYGFTGMVGPNQVIALLRRQHRAMVNLVKNMPRIPYLVSDSLMRSAVIETLKHHAK